VTAANIRKVNNFL
jgi:hypothetical protein